VFDRDLCDFGIMHDDVDNNNHDVFCAGCHDNLENDICICHNLHHQTSHDPHFGYRQLVGQARHAPVRWRNLTSHYQQHYEF
jgi:hypothetical protein